MNPGVDGKLAEAAAARLMLTQARQGCYRCRLKVADAELEGEQKTASLEGGGQASK